MNCWEEFKEWYWECFAWNIILLLYSKQISLSFLVTNSLSTEREVSSLEVLSLSLCDLFITPTHGSALNYFPLHFQVFATNSNCSKSVGHQIVLLRFLTIIQYWRECDPSALKSRTSRGSSSLSPLIYDPPSAIHFKCIARIVAIIIIVRNEWRTWG